MHGMNIEHKREWVEWPGTQDGPSKCTVCNKGKVLLLVFSTYINGELHDSDTAAVKCENDCWHEELA